MSRDESDEEDRYSRIANWLFGRLAMIYVATVVFTVSEVPAGPFGLVGFWYHVLVYLVALYLTVHVVFSALNELLEARLDAKLETLEDRES